MVWLCEHGEGLGLETLSSDYHPVLLFSVPSAPTLLETAGTTKYRPQSLWESSAQAELLLALPHPGPQIQRVIYESAATHPSVFKPRHVLSSLCGLVRYRVLLRYRVRHLDGFPGGAGGSPCVYSARED